MYSAANLLTLLNDSLIASDQACLYALDTTKCSQTIRYNLAQNNSNKSLKLLKILLAIVKYVEVPLEMCIEKSLKNGKYSQLVLIESVKFI